jgi:hypothetical protein
MSHQQWDQVILNANIRWLQAIHQAKANQPQQEINDE